MKNPSPGIKMNPIPEQYSEISSSPLKKGQKFPQFEVEDVESQVNEEGKDVPEPVPKLLTSYEKEDLDQLVFKNDSFNTLVDKDKWNDANYDAKKL